MVSAGDAVIVVALLVVVVAGVNVAIEVATVVAELVEA